MFEVTDSAGEITLTETDHDGTGSTGCGIEAVREGRLVLTETLSTLVVVGSVELATTVIVPSYPVGAGGGVEVSEQTVVVTLTTVVEVWTTVALAGQFVASVAHLVTM